MQRVGTVIPLGHRARIAACTIAFLAVASPVPAQQAAEPAPTPTPTTTLDRIKESGRIRIGYSAEAQPFSFRDASGNPAGYSVELCQKVADAAKAELGLASVNMEWVPVTVEDRFRVVQQGEVDLLCGADTETMTRRKDVAFSIPVFPGGIGALLRSDAPARLREVLSGRPSSSPKWRASAGQLLQTQTFAVVNGTTAETWLNGKLSEFQLTAEVVPVDSYEAGIQQLLDRKADVFFGDRPILLSAVTGNLSGGKLMVQDRIFTYEVLALAFQRGDEDFRLLVDRTLTRLYASAEFDALYVKWFGEPDADVLTFFRWNTRPE